jgi:putative flippase GtrA
MTGQALHIRLQQLAGHPLAAKLLRFAVTGSISGLGFAVVTLGLLHGFGLSPSVATVVGYLAVLPLSFLGHRRLTFRSAGRLTPEFRRFCLSFATGLLTSVMAMHVATDWLGLAPVFGVGLAVLLVPIITFLIMNNWVFRDQADQKDSSHGA